MANKPRYTAGQVAAALLECRGMMYLAAKRLGCDPETIRNYCKRYQTVEQAKQDARGELLDMAELKLWAAVQRGEAWAIAFALKTLGRNRGFVEKLDLTLQIEQVAQRVAAEVGLSAAAVLAEAQQLLAEVDTHAE